jgi:peptidoglycan L-alanyl-D-glutamate endopeptidase CwlK
LHPRLQAIAAELLEKCKTAGYAVAITSTLRTAAEQDELYKAGKSKAKGTDYQSGHQWGVAMDFCQNVKGANYPANSRPFWAGVGRLAETLGLRWGGTFKSPDRPHLEIAGLMPNGSTAALKRQYGTPEKFMATWGGADVPSPPPDGGTSPGGGGKGAARRTLSKGASGADVKEMQTLLIKAGIAMPKYGADGAFGTETLNAVKMFQTLKKLAVDGVCGPKTWEQLTVS